MAAGSYAMLFIPIADINERHKPAIINLSLIIINIGVFLYTYFMVPDYYEFVKTWGFTAASPSLLTAVTSCFFIKAGSTSGGICSSCGFLVIM